MVHKFTGAPFEPGGVYVVHPHLSEAVDIRTI